MSEPVKCKCGGDSKFSPSVTDGDSSVVHCQLCCVELSAFCHDWDDETLISHWNAIMSDTAAREEGARVALEAVAKKFEGQTMGPSWYERELVPMIRSISIPDLFKDHGHD